MVVGLFQQAHSTTVRGHRKPAEAGIKRIAKKATCKCRYSHASFGGAILKLMPQAGARGLAAQLRTDQHGR